MSSQVRVTANRRNAAKSTGPRTVEGKAVVAGNAVKHGLLARAAVLKDEDPQEFDLHRSRMLRKLAPDGPEEEAMAERIVALWWRLKRAERMQDEALDYLIEADRGDGWVKCRRQDGDPSARAELAFGRAVARDFAEGRSLDRLTMYERRIEGSLYRTMKELRQVQREGKSQDGRRPSSSDDLRNHGWHRQAEPAPLADGVGSHPEAIGKHALDAATHAAVTNSAKQSQFEGPQEDHRQASLDAATPTVVSDCVKQSQSEGPQDDHRQASLDDATPTGVSDCVKQSQIPEGVSCETKPMEAAGSACSVPARACPEPTEGASQETPCGVATNGDGAAKQSQWRGPAAGVVLRPRPRVAYRYHNVAGSC